MEYATKRVDHDLISHQVFLEKLYNKNQTTKRIAEEFTESKQVDFIAHLEENEVPVEFGIGLLTQMALHKRASLPTLVGILRHHFGNSQATVDMIQRCMDIGLVSWDKVTQTFVVIFQIGQAVQDDLDRYQYPLPMVVKPKTVGTNKETGYLLGSGSLILKDNHHDDDICLDHINRMNAVRLTLDMDTATMIQNQWRDLDKVKPGESKHDFERRKKAFEKYDRTCKDVFETLTMHSDSFYLTHKYDKRGRTYCQGYHVDYQGNAWNKAVVQLADKELVE